MSASSAAGRAPLRIGLNLLYLIPGVVGGTEKYAEGLIGGLAQINGHNEYVVFVNHEAADWPLPDQANIKRVQCAIAATSRARRYLFEQLRLPTLVQRHRIDVLHSLGYVAPLASSCPSVVTIHDLNFRALANEMPLLKRHVLASMVRASAVRATRVVTDSEYSRAQLLEFFKLRPSKVVTVHLAAPQRREHLPEQDAILQRLGVQSPYVLSFSSASPHKNLERLIDAFSLAVDQSRLPHFLVVVGHVPPSSRSRERTNGRVVFTGYVPDALVPTLLRHATMLVVPSLYEGFGLPVVEANSAGVPVVSSGRGSLSEIGGKAALTFDPLDVEDMARKISAVAVDASLRRALVELGLQNAQRFSWKATAAQMLEIYNEIGRPG